MTLAINMTFFYSNLCGYVLDSLKTHSPMVLGPQRVWRFPPYTCTTDRYVRLCWIMLNTEGGPLVTSTQ